MDRYNMNSQQQAEENIRNFEPKRESQEFEPKKSII
jgi:hypothetical protein